MSEFEGLAELFEEAEEGSIDSAVAEGVEGQAAAFEEVGVEAEADVAEDAAGQTPAQAMEEGANEITEDVTEGTTSIAEKMKGAMKWMWNSKWKFAKFVGMETAKGALFYAGMKALEKIMAKDSATTPKSPELTQRLAIIKGCNKAGDVLNPIITEWRAWLTKHFDQRESYGSVAIPDMDVTVSRYQILQNKLSSFDAAQDTIHPLVTAANKTKDVASAQALLAKWKEYVASVLKLTLDIRDKEPQMVKDELKDHNADIQAAYTALVLVV